MISSLRRNLQREHLERLIDLTLANGPGTAASKPISNLALMELRETRDAINGVLEKMDTKIDPYSRAHLSEAVAMIDRALDAQLIYNTDDLVPSYNVPMIIFGDENDARSPRSPNR